jgi:hypothetical protein
LYKEAAMAKVARRARRDVAREEIVPELSENFMPPPLSEFAIGCGVVFEGWLEKRSKSGIWQRRWFVLAESRTEFCVLRIYSSCMKTAWGEVGIRLKAAIPVVALERIESRTARDPTASGREFLLVVADCSHFRDESAPTSTQQVVLAESTELYLRADESASRLMWIYFLRQAREAALDSY